MREFRHRRNSTLEATLEAPEVEDAPSISAWRGQPAQGNVWSQEQVDDCPRPTPRPREISRENTKNERDPQSDIEIRIERGREGGREGGSKGEGEKHRV